MPKHAYFPIKTDWQWSALFWLAKIHKRSILFLANIMFSWFPGLPLSTSTVWTVISPPLSSRMNWKIKHWYNWSNLSRKFWCKTWPNIVAFSQSRFANFFARLASSICLEKCFQIWGKPFLCVKYWPSYEFFPYTKP